MQVPPKRRQQRFVLAVGNRTQDFSISTERDRAKRAPVRASAFDARSPVDVYRRSEET